MKRIIVTLLIVLSVCLTACGKDNTQSQVTEVNNNKAVKANGVQQSNDELLAKIAQLEQDDVLFPRFSELAFNFMTALQEEDINLLKKSVSDTFTIEIKGEKWYYISDEAIDGTNKILLYNDDNEVEYWRIDYYGRNPMTNAYGMSIRLFTDKNIKADVADVINLEFAEVNGAWKIASLSKDV